MLGFDRERKLINVGDTADLYAYLFDSEDAPIDAADLESVEFTIQKPDKTKDILPGTIEPDGAGFLLYPADQQGQYVVVAQFTFTDGRIQSTQTNFEVFDPFLVPVPPNYDTLTDSEKQQAMEDIVTEAVWNRFEDLFDSSDGGPWMRDMTLNIFGPQKIKNFISEVIFDINVYNPPTNFDIGEFAQPILNKTNPNLTVLVQGTMCAVIRHLMRTYAEQPLPTGGQVTYEDRRDYLQRWGTMYQIEWQHFDHLVKLWKRQFLSFGHSKVLVSNKAGRLLPAPLRTRNIGRGYY
jgi:hypothetical protein